MGWDAQVQREFPGTFESTNLSMDNLSREIGRMRLCRLVRNIFKSMAMRTHTHTHTRTHVYIDLVPVTRYGGVLLGSSHVDIIPDVDLA